MNTATYPCPSCDSKLEAKLGSRGIVWICRSCNSGAATLPILRQVAPRAFVDQVWQAALKNGRVSTIDCPSCTQPFTTFVDSAASVEPQLEVCTRCYWVWLSPSSMAALPEWTQESTGLQRAERALAAHAAREGELAVDELQEALLWAAGTALLSP